jgi:phage gp46-like protein
MNYTGDLLIQEDSSGNFDLCFENGQPCMTDGLETYVILAVFGEDWWGNGLVKSDSEKMKSEFPSIIRRNVVTDKTKNDGAKAIEKALAPMIKDKIARSVKVSAIIKTSFCIGWIVEIQGIDDKSYKYFINWERGQTTAQIVRGK